MRERSTQESKTQIRRLMRRLCFIIDEANWYRTRFCYHNTLLQEDLGVYIDHHFFPFPRPARILAIEEGLGCERLCYRYYVADSLDDRLEQFCMSRESDEDTNHGLIMEVVPRYSSEAKREEFELFLSRALELLIAEKTLKPKFTCLSRSRSLKISWQPPWMLRRRSRVLGPR